MGLLDRFRPATRADDWTYTAIPLIPDEVALLVEAFHEDDRLTRTYRPDIGGGSGYSRNQARCMSHRAGVGAALGCPVIPLTVGEIGMLDYVLGTLRKWAPNGQTTRRFELLLTRMHVLTGMAQVNGWKVRHVDGALRWHPDPPIVPGEQPSGQRQIGNQ